MEELKQIAEQIAGIMDEIKENNVANINGNKAAGRRARVKSVELGKMLRKFRVISVAANKK